MKLHNVVPLLLLLFFLTGNKPSMPAFPSPEAKGETREELCQRILEDLLNAKGVKNIPKFKFSDKEEMVAWADFKANEVGIENKAYEICRSFGADSINAIAALLAHEVIHYSEKHTWEFNFAREFRNTQMGQDFAANLEIKNFEIRADYLGGFLAYAAGYQTLGIMPDLLEKVYKAYTIDPNNSTNYPVFEERKQLAIKGEQKLKELVDIFDLGNMLAVIEEYDHAYECYQNILIQQYEGREVLNNLGVLAFLSSLQYFRFGDKEGEIPNYKFPVELDAESRINVGSKDVDLSLEEKKNRREQKLREAIGYFQRARDSDKHYPIAWLNEGCAMALLAASIATEGTEEALEEAEDLRDDAERAAKRKGIRKARKRGDDKVVADAYVLLGILAHMNGDLEEAREELEEAASRGAKRLSAANMALIEPAESSGGTTAARLPCSTDLETVDNQALTLIDISRKDTIKTKFDEDIRREVPTIMLWAAKEPLPASKVLADVYLDEEKETNKILASFLVTNEDYTGETNCGIRIGSSFSRVKEEYGEPDNYMEIGRGQFVLYRTPKLIFQIEGPEPEQVVTRWAVFNQPPAN